MKLKEARKRYESPYRSRAAGVGVDGHAANQLAAARLR